MTGLASNFVLTIPLLVIVTLAVLTLRNPHRETGETSVKDDSNAPGDSASRISPVPLFASTVERFASDWGWPR